MSPGECVKLKPNALSYDRRLDMRLEYACSKEDSGDMHLETATLAALVHKYKSDVSQRFYHRFARTFGGVNRIVKCPGIDPVHVRKDMRVTSS
jgi:hypothetical protein